MQCADKAVEARIYDTDEIALINEVSCQYSDMRDEIKTPHFMQCDLWKEMY